MAGESVIRTSGPGVPLFSGRAPMVTRVSGAPMIRLGNMHVGYGSHSNARRARLQGRTVHNKAWPAHSRPAQKRMQAFLSSKTNIPHSGDWGFVSCSSRSGRTSAVASPPGHARKQTDRVEPNRTEQQDACVTMRTCIWDSARKGVTTWTTELSCVY